MDANTQQLTAVLGKSLADDTFIKLVLSNYKGREQGLQKIFVRTVETKRGLRLMFQARFETRDTVKNFSFDEALSEASRLLASGFRNAHLFTTASDLQLTIGKRNSRLIKGKPTAHRPPSIAHDRQKRKLIDPNAFYLKALGIANDKGEIKPGQSDKWRQINKFVEILAGLIENSPLKEKTDLKIVDMGSGKGYLTFAAFDFLTRAGGNAGREAARRVSMTGVEQRGELVDLCNEVAAAGGFDGLRFVQGRIEEFDASGTDILIALHACDTATDDAIFKGIEAGAAIIVAAPCCHKELRKQAHSPDLLTGILKHGSMMERAAEMVTDGLRSLILEREGYAARLFDFVPTEHTPKNTMLVGVFGNEGRAEIARQIDEIKQAFGINEQRLERLLLDRRDG